MRRYTYSYRSYALRAQRPARWNPPRYLCKPLMSCTLPNIIIICYDEYLYTNICTCAFTGLLWHTHVRFQRHIHIRIEELVSTQTDTRVRRCRGQPALVQQPPPGVAGWREAGVLCPVAEPKTRVARNTASLSLLLNKVMMDDNDRRKLGQDIFRTLSRT